MAAPKVSLKAKAFKLEGVPQMIKLVQSIGETLAGETKGAFDEKVRDALLVPAQMMADEARDMCPFVTGTLRDSIKAMKLRKNVGAFVFTDGVRYAHMVEHGTSKTQAKPFFRPGINAIRPMAANVMAEGLKQVIEDITQGDSWHEGDGSPT